MRRTITTVKSAGLRTKDRDAVAAQRGEHVAQQVGPHQRADGAEAVAVGAQQRRQRAVANLAQVGADHIAGVCAPGGAAGQGSRATMPCACKLCGAQCCICDVCPLMSRTLLSKLTSVGDLCSSTYSRAARHVNLLART